MTYNEIVDTIRAEKPILNSEINGEQLIMLIRDHVIKTVNSFGTVYEINMIPIDYYPASCIMVNIDTCPTFNEGEKVITKMLQYYKSKQPINIELEDKWFHIEIDILETEE